MNLDRLPGSAKEIRGKVKVAFGGAVGDARLEAEGTVGKFEGKAQNAVGGLKDAVKGKKDPLLRAWSRHEPQIQ